MARHRESAGERHGDACPRHQLAYSDLITSPRTRGSAENRFVRGSRLVTPPVNRAAFGASSTVSVVKALHHFKSRLVMLHLWRSTEATNNGMYGLAATAPAFDAQRVFSASLRMSLGLPAHIQTVFDQRKASGVYQRFWELAVISLCSDIEFFFKDLFERTLPSSATSFRSFQHFLKVVGELGRLGIDLEELGAEIGDLAECFQVRHICVHNMGFVDKRFKDQIDTSLQIGEKYIVDQEIYKRFPD